jgi:hypothetical protein
VKPISRALLGVAGLALLGLLVSWLTPGAIDDRAPESRPREPAQNGIAAKSAAATKTAPRAQAEESHLADELNSPTTTIRSDLQIVAELTAAYRSNFPKAGNPVGDNAEITAALTGRNALGLALIPRRHRAIDRNGELCDRWGTPFFFHAESGTKMEIRSAGPDRKMWNDDDVVLSP